MDRIRLEFHGVNLTPPLEADTILWDFQRGRASPLVKGGVQYPAREVASFILDGSEYQCQLHADFIGNERILGRDVLNSLEVLFRGPSGEVVINP